MQGDGDAITIEADAEMRVFVETFGGGGKKSAAQPVAWCTSAPFRYAPGSRFAADRLAVLDGAGTGEIRSAEMLRPDVLAVDGRRERRRRLGGVPPMLVVHVIDLDLDVDVRLGGVHPDWGHAPGSAVLGLGSDGVREAARACAAILRRRVRRVRHPLMDGVDADRERVLPLARRLLCKRGDRHREPVAVGVHAADAAPGVERSEERVGVN
jgi:hypothetical protein